MRLDHSPKCGNEKPGCAGVRAISAKPAGRLRIDVAQYPAPRINPERPGIPAGKERVLGPFTAKDRLPVRGGGRLIPPKPERFSDKKPG